MALIGMLEQFQAASVLQRIEAHEKTGLLIIKQRANWVEMYVRDGRLMCVGPVRTNVTLGERLLQDGVISPYAFQEMVRVIGQESGETRIALTLMEAGAVGKEALRSWAIGKVQEILQVVLTWSSGEIHFEEGVVPPSDRLLVAMSFSSLLSSLSTVAPFPDPVYDVPTPRVPPAQAPALPKSDISKKPTLTNPEQFYGSDTPIQAMDRPSFSAGSLIDPSALSIESPVMQAEFLDASQLLMENPPATPTFSEAQSFAPSFTPPASPDASSFSISPPVPVMTPTPPRYVDTSYMRPEMVIVPADLAAWREPNPSVQLTPEQWRLLTRVDGHTTLQSACQDLAMTPDNVCRITGELVSEGLVRLHASATLPIPLPEPAPAPDAMPNVYNGYPNAGYAMPPMPPPNQVSPMTPPRPATPPPTADVLPQYASFMSFETESQWGNGGNGATFVPGRGWVATPRPIQSNNSFASYPGNYVQVGYNRR